MDILGGKLKLYTMFEINCVNIIKPLIKDLCYNLKVSICILWIVLIRVQNHTNNK